ncbi:conserved oligomeric Golgi complex subunit 4-like [Mizuhopecten yessoensis]|uniref:Conserved oligomeric Golgi complex subunit 4 n=1 Tax=Mizuhopecten yessoensis TaxID=6573 RepID=A0A210QH25_MIZYE|nr:conserved oligomeric Golgi complex subunit 4-like [Mizuhopecten yessoensis]OWF48034.1 Conserved oligomeric Golgi complex subunit 4 [Mizuhopecten yessoensis]
MAASRGGDATSVSALETMENLTDIEEIKHAFEKLCSDEDDINIQLDGLLEHQASLENKMSGLQRIVPNIQILETDSKQLSSMVSFTSTLAENVSSKVRQLDLAKSNVTAAITRVEDILDLKFCTDGVQTALQNEDYEKAAGHVHRFRSLDENILRMSSDADEGGTLEISFKLLHEAEEKLKTIVSSKFDAAVHAGDLASVERFFKIFPLLGQHEEGLTKFGKHLASQLADTSDKNLKIAEALGSENKGANCVFADTATQLFESIARIVEIRQPLVETYYGHGKLFMLLKFLQKECDRQSRKILQEFKRKRMFDFILQQVQQNMVFHKPNSTDKFDAKDLDVLLAEVVLLNTRTELYLRFFRRRAMNDIEAAAPGQTDFQGSDVNTFLVNCDLSRLMQELIGSYIMMEEFFMREMVLKAVSVDSVDEGAQTSSMVDDSFFIVKKCVRRAISSSSVDGVCAMLNHACTLLEQDFREVLYSRLRSGFPLGFDLVQAYNMVQSSIKGNLKTSDTEQAKTLFIVSLNNAEATCEYCKALKTSLNDEVSKLFNKCEEQSKAKLESCLSDLAAVGNRYKDVVDFGFSQLNSSAIKPRIKPLTDSFLSTGHTISEEDFSNYEANDPWVQNFIMEIDNTLGTFKSSLSSGNYDRFVSIITAEVTSQLERAVLKTAYNRLGGLQFDKELRSLVGYLTTVTTWTIRDKFARLTQMATILNLEKVTEILDYWGPNSGPLTWRLTPTEVRHVLSLRVDFRSEDIKRLKL